MTYTYPKYTGSIAVMALKVEKAGLPLPDGMIADAATVGVIYNSIELTAPQKATLDSIMGNASVGQIPSSTNSIFIYRDVLQHRAEFNMRLAEKGLSCDIYPYGPGEVLVIFNKNLKNLDKTNVDFIVDNYFLVTVQ